MDEPTAITFFQSLTTGRSDRFLLTSCKIRHGDYLVEIAVWIFGIRISLQMSVIKEKGFIAAITISIPWSCHANKHARVDRLR